MTNPADVVVIHTDGGCRPNPGPGGWGAVLRQREHVREMCGGESGETSNNRMELTAPIMALEALTKPVVVHLYTDSTYVRSGITKWVLGWERNGWKTAAKQPVKNVDLWKRLQIACARHQVEWFWVKGNTVQLRSIVIRGRRSGWGHGLWCERLAAHLRTLRLTTRGLARRRRLGLIRWVSLVIAHCHRVAIASWL